MCAVADCAVAGSKSGGLGPGDRGCQAPAVLYIYQVTLGPDRLAWLSAAWCLELLKLLELLRQAQPVTSPLEAHARAG